MASAAIEIAPEIGSWTRTPQAIRAWLTTARAGDEMVYAHGGRLAPKCPSAAVARALAEARHVTLVQRRRAAGIDYLMRRLKPAKASIGRANKPAKAKLDGDMVRLLRVLRGLARTGAACPGNRALAKQAGIGGADQASYVLRKLVNAGLVTSRVVDNATGARVVTIVALGQATGLPGSGR